MTIRTKLFATIALLSAVLVLTVGGGLWALARVERSGVESQEAGNRVAEQAVPLLSATKDVRFDVVQVQQWLTDVSATQAKDGLGDGFDVAKEFAGRFKEDSDTAIALAQAAGLADIVAALRAMQTDFAPYYATGIKMATAYVATGPDGGNKLMSSFDAAAEVMGDRLEALSNLTEDYIARSIADAKAGAEASAADVHLIQNLSSVPVVLGVIVALLSGAIVLGVARALDSMTGTMGRLSTGDLTVAIPSIDRADEVGAMAKSVGVFKEALTSAGRLRAEQDALRTRTEQERRAMMITLADRFESRVSSVVAAVAEAAEQLQHTAQSLSSTAGETTRQSSVVATASEQTMQNVQTVAAATEELSSSIQEIGSQAAESARIVGSAVTQANETSAKVNALSEAAAKIGSVVTLISEVANQTNLLALNATIEAARAGEAGKGFAVVASEVKSLAGQTARATEDIAGHIKAIQASTESSAKGIHDIAQTINRVDEISTAIAAAVEEQGAATREISRSAQQAAAGSSDVSTSIASVTEASLQTGAGAAQVLAAADALTKNGANLRRQVDEFLREIRAG